MTTFLRSVICNSSSQPLSRFGHPSSSLSPPQVSSKRPCPVFGVAVTVVIGLMKYPIINPAVCQVVDSLDYLRAIHAHPSGLDAYKGTVVGNATGTHSRASSAWLRRCFFSVSNSWAICAGVRRVKGHVGHCVGVFM